MDITSYILGKKAGGGSAPTGTIEITENGTTNVSNYAYANVDVQPDLEAKSITITENTTTTITPTSGKDGLSSVEIITNVSGGGGGEDFKYPEFTQIYDSSCVGGEPATSLTTSVNALKDNVVYAMVCARAQITMPSGWTLLKTEKCYSSPDTQTTYVYYKLATADETVSLTVNQSSSERLFLSMFAMQGSYKPATIFKNAEIQLPSGSIPQVVQINDVDLVEGDIILLSVVYIGQSPVFGLQCNATKYSTTSNSTDRFAAFRMDENCNDLKVKISSNVGTWCYIVIRPEVGTTDVNKLLNAHTDSLFEQTLTSVGSIVKKAPLKLKLDTSIINLGNFFGSYGLKNIKAVDLSEFDTSNVTIMTNAFYDTKISRLDLSNFITTKVTSMNGMFRSTVPTDSAIRYIDFRNATVTSNTDCSYMFNGCSNLEFLDIRNMDVTLLSDSKSLVMFTLNRTNISPSLTIIVKNSACETWIRNKIDSTSRVTFITADEYEGS